MILADTKYEMGLDENGALLLADEIHTPDSSRYWFADSYERALREGGDPKSFDKEFVRRWLVSEHNWRGEGPPPALPDDVRCEAARRYLDAYAQLTGAELIPDTDPPEARIAKALSGLEVARGSGVCGAAAGFGEAFFAAGVRGEERDSPGVRTVLPLHAQQQIGEPGGPRCPARPDN